MELERISVIHFIGVGGVSMNALAKLMLKRGKSVSGSDAVDSTALSELRQMGANVYVGTDFGAVMRAELVVVTAAIPNGDRELTFAGKLKIPVMERAAFLGLVAKDFKNVIAVSGTHGKTTVTALTSAVFRAANVCASAHIGGYCAATDGNYYHDGDDFLIAEACEYKRGFLHILPNLAVVLNVESDHPDCFNNLDELYETFDAFVHKTICCGGNIVINGDSTYYQINKGAYKDMYTFGLADTNVCRAVNMTECNGKYAFDVHINGCEYGHIESPLLGLHNVYNVLAAISICEHFNIDKRVVLCTLSAFCGVSQRMERLGEINGAEVYCDYAHHPSELAATLTAARALTHGRLLVYFQPHTYSRTARLFYEFAESLLHADYLGLVATYPAREKPSEGKSAFDLYLHLKKERTTCYFCDVTAACQDAKKAARKGDLVLFVGAGDISSVKLSS